MGKPSCHVRRGQKKNRKKSEQLGFGGGRGEGAPYFLTEFTSSIYAIGSRGKESGREGCRWPDVDQKKRKKKRGISLQQEGTAW